MMCACSAIAPTLPASFDTAAPSTRSCPIDPLACGSIGYDHWCHGIPRGIGWHVASPGPTSMFDAKKPTIDGIWTTRRRCSAVIGFGVLTDTRTNAGGGGRIDSTRSKNASSVCRRITITSPCWMFLTINQVRCDPPAIESLWPSCDSDLGRWSPRATNPMGVTIDASYIQWPCCCSAVGSMKVRTPRMYHRALACVSLEALRYPSPSNPTTHTAEASAYVDLPRRHHPGSCLCLDEGGIVCAPLHTHHTHHVARQPANLPTPTSVSPDHPPHRSTIQPRSRCSSDDCARAACPKCFGPAS
eukprot:m.156049 g.156049  ORF g.156049 m.156049 type:complete len:301 (-) comp23605_c0_seq2:29-931(-)